MNYDRPTSHIASKESPLGNLGGPRARRVTFITIAAVVAVLAGLWGFQTFKSMMMADYFANNKPPPLAVASEIVSPATMPRYMTAIGSVAAVHQVTIAPEVAGRVTKFTFLPGMEVKTGDVLVQLNDAPERANLAAAQAQARLAKLAIDRQRELLERGHVSRAAFDQAQTQYDAAVAEAGRHEALVAQKRIRAPFDGVLGVRQVEVGMYVNTGAPLVTLTDIASLYVEFTLPEQARPNVKLFQDMEIAVDAYPGRTFTGKVAVIDPQVMLETRTVKVQAVVDNTERLLSPGMFANVKVALPPRENTLTVSETAVDHNVYGDFVYVVKDAGAGPDGKPQLKVALATVTTGERARGRVAVLSGLNPGDRVVTTGQVKLFDGAPIALGAEPVLIQPKDVPRQ